MVEYDSGERTFVALSASAGGVDVCLSTPSLQLEPAYIGLCSQKTLKIVNRSEIPVKFSWEAFATSEEEEVRTLWIAVPKFGHRQLENSQELTKAWRDITTSPVKDTPSKMLYYCKIVTDAPFVS